MRSWCILILFKFTFIIYIINNFVIYFVELQEDETLWNKSSELAADLNVDRYQVMYALYEANKDSFENNDINKIQYGRELVLSEEMIFALSPGDANDVVKRHIYCGC